MHKTKKSRSRVTPTSGLSIKLNDFNEFELPFKEWDDQEVNAEKWDLSTVQAVQTDFRISKGPLMMTEQQTQIFQDPQSVHMPYNIVAYEWKRPSEVFPDSKLVVYDPANTGYPNLKAGSKHLLHSDLVRHFISTIDVLIYLSYSGKFTQDSVECKGYYPVTKGEIWQPWHHIYSKNSCGPGGRHLPQINAFGKYIVRLFWMGTWRKIYVDDRLPVDKLGHLMLPSNELTPEEKVKQIEIEKKLAAEKSILKRLEAEAMQAQLDWNQENNPNKKHKKASKTVRTTTKHEKVAIIETVELWPVLLFKAILKLASLTWHDRYEIVDFDILHCFTGWLPQKIKTSKFSALSVWDMIHGYTDQYTYGSRVTLSSKRAKSASSKNSPRSKSSKSKSKQSGSSKPGKDADDQPASIPFVLMANCSDLRDNYDVPNISPCWGHTLLIEQTRDLPLVPPPKYDFPLWKHFRWIKWAISKGLLPPDDTCHVRKCYKIVSPFCGYSEYVVYRQPTDECLQAQQRMAARVSARQQEERRRTLYQVKEQKKKGKKLDKKESKSIKASSKGSSKSKSSKSSQKSQKAKAGKLKDQNLDISFWTDYEKLSENIESIVLYFIPSKFEKEYKIVVEPLKYIKVTDPQQNLKENVLHSCTSIKEIRNGPWYLFTDSLDYKMFVFSLSDTGSLGRLKRTILFSEEDHDDKNEEDNCLTHDLFFRVKKYYDMEINEEFKIQYDPDNMENSLVRKSSNYCSLVVTKYNWQEDKIGKMVCYLGTLGTNTVTFQVPPGRHLFQLWIRNSTVHSPYFYCDILSDTDFVLGTFPIVLDEGMKMESHRLIKCCHELSENYAQLVQSFGDSQFKDSLRQFYLNYSFSLSSLNKKDKNLAYDKLYSILYETVEESLAINNEEILKNLRILFLKFDLPFMGTQELDDCFNLILNDDDMIYYKVMQRSACKLQAFFKSCYVRLQKAKHDPRHTQYMKIFDNLHTLYVHNFAVQNRFRYCFNIWRKFFNFLQEFPVELEIYEDLNNTVTTYEFEDGINLVEDTWLPICQYVFYVNSPCAIPIKMNLITDIDQTYVRVFNNDTNEEIKRYTNNVATVKYGSNINGYTAFCYGYPKYSGNSYWRMIFITRKEIRDNLLIIPLATWSRYTAIDYYIPNKLNHLFTYRINIQDNAALSIRLVANYKSAELVLRIRDIYGKKVREVIGGHALIMAGVFLESEIHSYRMLKNDIQTPSKATISGKKTGSGLAMKRASRSAKRLDSPSKKSADRASRKSDSSQNARKKTPKNANMISIPEHSGKKTVYYLEGFIQENSWELTQAEWNVVLKVKESRLRIQPVDLYKIKGVRTNIGVLFKNIHGPLEVVPAMRQDFPEQPPFWTLEIICDESDDISLVRDTSKEDEFKANMNSWFKEDSDRKDKAFEFRQRYLDKKAEAGNYFKVEEDPAEIGLGNVGDFYNTRSAVSPKITQNWEPFDLKSYYLSKDVEDVKEKPETQKDYINILFEDKSKNLEDIDKEPKEFLVLKDFKKHSSQKSTESLKMTHSDSAIKQMLNEVKESLLKLGGANVQDCVIKVSHGDITVCTDDSNEEKDSKSKNENKPLPHIPSRQLKTEKEIQEDVENRQKACNEYNILIEESRENISKYLESELAQYEVLNHWFKECKKDSAEIMNYAYDLRQKYIQCMLRAYEKQKPLKGGKKKKKRKQSKE